MCRIFRLIWWVFAGESSGLLIFMVSLPCSIPRIYPPVKSIITESQHSSWNGVHFFNYQWNNFSSDNYCVFKIVLQTKMTLNETSLEKKFENVTNSQESIQSLSLWILHHKIHHKRIVEIWMKCLEKGSWLYLVFKINLFFAINYIEIFVTWYVSVKTNVPPILQNKIISQESFLERTFYYYIF